MEITSKQHITEQIIRNLNRLEDGLDFVDSNISTVGDERLDILALDKNNRMVLICVRDKPQTFRTKRGIHILKESVALWDWVVDFKDDYFDGIKQIIGIKPIKVPPRMFLIAPGFAPNLIDLAAEVSIRIDIALFTYNPKSFDIDKKPFSNVSMDNRPKADPKAVKLFNDYHGIELLTLRKKAARELLSKKIKAYDPVKVDDHFKKLNATDSKIFKEFIEQLKRRNILPYSTKNHIFFKNEHGETVARVIFGPGKTLDIETIYGKPVTRKHFKLSETAKALTTIQKA